MGSFCEGSPAQTQTSSSTSGSTQALPWVQQDIQDVMNRANSVAQTPWQPYPGQFTAGFTPDQNAALANSNYLANGNYLAPYTTTAGNTFGYAGQNYGTAAGISQGALPYMSSGSDMIGAGASYIPGAGGMIQGGQGMIQGALGNIGQADSMASSATNPMTLMPYNVEPYMSPYINDVVNSTQNQFTNANAQQGNALLGQAIRSGNAFGGDRAGIAAAQLGGQQQLAQAPVIAGLYNSGFLNAQNEFNAQQSIDFQRQQAQNQNRLAAAGIYNQGAGLGIQGGQAYGQLGTQYAGLGMDLANMGTARSNIGAQVNQVGSTLGGIAAGQSSLGANIGSLGLGVQNALQAGNNSQFTMGQAQQQTNQNDLNAQYAQWLQQQAYPFQTTAWNAGITGALGPTAGSTSTGTGTGTGTQQAAYNPFSQVLGGAVSLGSAALIGSDERMKTDKRVVGKTFDGQPIYSFKYKGNDTTHMGLMAQEVEKDHPEAVEEDGSGMKYVDYGMATADAHPHKAGGGGMMSGAPPFMSGPLYGDVHGYVPTPMGGSGARLASNQMAQPQITFAQAGADPLKGITDGFASALKMKGKAGNGLFGGGNSPQASGTSVGADDFARGGGIPHYDDGGPVYDPDAEEGNSAYLAQQDRFNDMERANDTLEGMVMRGHFRRGGGMALGGVPDDLGADDGGIAGGDMPPSFTDGSLDQDAQPFQVADNLDMTGRLETGSRGPINISPDTGGSRSYGRLGLNSGTGSARAFAAQNPDLGLTARPGTPEFDTQWRRAVTEDPEAVKAAESAWHEKNVMGPVKTLLEQSGINPDIGTDPRVLSFLADRRVQMGNLGWGRVLYAAKNNDDPVAFMKQVSDLDRANLKSDFRSYLSGRPQDLPGLENRVSNRLAMSLKGEGEGEGDGHEGTGMPREQDDIPESVTSLSSGRGRPRIAMADSPANDAGGLFGLGAGMGADNRRALGMAGLMLGAGMMSGGQHFGQNVGRGIAAGAQTYAGMRQQDIQNKMAEEKQRRDEIRLDQGDRRADIAEKRAEEAARHGRETENFKRDRESRLDARPYAIGPADPETGVVPMGVWDDKLKQTVPVGPDGKPIAPAAPAPGAAATPPEGVQTASAEPMRPGEGIIMANKRAVEAGPYNYAKSAPHIEKGMDVPEPAEISRKSKAALQADAEFYLNTGKLPPVGAGKTPLAYERQRYQDAVKNYGNALAESRGMTPKELAEMWQSAPGMSKFIIGPDGRATVALGVGMRHLDTLQQLAKEWGANPNSQTVNRLKAMLAREFGDASVTNLETAGKIVGPEVIKAIGIAGGGTGKDRAAATELFSAARTPEQLMGAIKTTQKLFAGQLEGKRAHAKEAGVDDARFKRLVGERPHQLLLEMQDEGKEPPAAATPAAPTARTTPVRPPVPKGVPPDSSYSPSLMKWRSPDGKQFYSADGKPE